MYKKTKTKVELIITQLCVRAKLEESERNVEFQSSPHLNHRTQTAAIEWSIVEFSNSEVLGTH